MCLLGGRAAKDDNVEDEGTHDGGDQQGRRVPCVREAFDMRDSIVGVIARQFVREDEESEVP